MNIITLCVGEMSENCYIIPTSQGNAIIVDPGAEYEEILYSLNQRNLTLKKILLTHGHFDHIMAVSDLVNETNAEVFIHEDDKECLTNAYNNLLQGFSGQTNFNKIEKATFLHDKDTVTLDEYTFTVMHTPGHSKGSVLYICESEKVIFSGDTLFKGSVGNTSFPFSSYEKMKESIEKISKFNGDYEIYTGHGASTTLLEEKAHNIYFSGIDEI